MVDSIGDLKDWLNILMKNGRKRKKYMKAKEKDGKLYFKKKTETPVQENTKEENVAKAKESKSGCCMEYCPHCGAKL